MAEFSQSWLEAQLQRQMAPVRAPDSLWASIDRPARRQRTWMLWPVFASLLLLATGDLLWVAANARGSRIESNNPAEIRAWVKARTNMDVDVTCGGKVALSGARLLEMKDKLVTEISYNFRGQPGRMLIAGRGPGMAETRLDSSCARCHVESHGLL